jgi:hypothetical protein
MPAHLTRLGFAALLLLALCAYAGAVEPNLPCGFSPKDWCISPSGDPCGRHKNENQCRSDPLCKGMLYRGESVVRCEADSKGFWRNCPAVGCISR